jgi:hypothetical protein
MGGVGGYQQSVTTLFPARRDVQVMGGGGRVGGLACCRAIAPPATPAAMPCRSCSCCSGVMAQPARAASAAITAIRMDLPF